MTDLQKEFESTGYTSWINSDLYPDGRIYTKEYTQWLENKVLEMRHISVTDNFNVMGKIKIAYLFSFNYWQYKEPKYILVYAKNEYEARVSVAKQCFFNDGQIASPEDLELCTYIS